MAAAPVVEDSVQRDPPPRLVLTGADAAVYRADATRVALARLDAALLATLAVEGATSRQRLLQLLWPGEEPENARNVLRQRLFRNGKVLLRLLPLGNFLLQAQIKLAKLRRLAPEHRALRPRPAR
mgnify:CR=1 FL=1